MQPDKLCELSVATFDKLAERYTEKYFSLDVYDDYLKRFCGHLDKPGMQVLDIACGPGNVSAFLLRERPDLHITGVDLAPGMIKQARQKVPQAQSQVQSQIQFIVEDCRHLERLGKTFDAATYAFGLSYLTDSDADQFFASLGAVLRPSAPFYLSTMTGPRSLSGLDTSSSGDQIYIEYRPWQDVVAMVEDAGFGVVFHELVASPANASKQTQDLVLIAKGKAA